MKCAPLLFLALLVTAVQAQDAASDPVGYNTVTCLSGSDTFVSVSFHRPVVYKGIVGTVGTAELTPEGDPGWTAGALASGNGHFVKLLSGSKAGAFYEISGNSSGSLSLNLAGDSLAGVAAGDEMAVIPYWTLEALFPAGNTTIHQSGGTFSFQRKTEVLFPDLSGSGINLVPAGIYYQTSTGWKDAYNGNSAANPRLEPDQYIIIRHRAADATTTFAAAGTVDGWSSRSVLSAQAAVETDNPVANLRPVPVKLKDMGLLSGQAFVGSAGVFSFQRRDQLFAYDNALAGINRVPAHIYFYNTATSQWMDALAGNRVADEDVILPATGFIIRKYRNATGASSLWTHQWPSGQAAQ